MKSRTDCPAFCDPSPGLAIPWALYYNECSEKTESFIRWSRKVDDPAPKRVLQRGQGEKAGGPRIRENEIKEKERQTMRKLLSCILILAMLVTSAAAEEAYVNGLVGLLESIQLPRDRVTVKMTAEETLQAVVQGEEGMTDLSLDAGGSRLQLQVMEDQIYLGVDGMVLNLKYADLQSMLTPKMDLNVVVGLLQLAAERFIIPHASVDASEGLQITYEVTEKELIEDLTGFVDTVFSEETYIHPLEELLNLLSRFSDEPLPTVEQLIEAWQTEKEDLKKNPGDFHVAFRLHIDEKFTEIVCSGEIGTSSNLYLMDWNARFADECVTVDGKLTQRVQTASGTRDYDVPVNYTYNRGVWSFDLENPNRPYALHAEGSQSGGRSRFSVTVRRGKTVSDLVQGNYTLSEDSFSAMISVTNRRQVPFVISAAVDEHLIDISVTLQNGQRPFAVKLVQEKGDLAYGCLEFEQYGEAYTLVYDGEKAVLRTDSLNVIMTGAFESDHVYVLTLHPEFPKEPERTEKDAYVRLEYEGAEGNFVVTGKVIDPEGTTIFEGQMKCEPAEGITEKLSEAEQVIYLTPEMLLELLTAQ